jgi:hypothetical protein
MDPAAPGRFDMLQKSFKAASKCVLTACSREVSCSCFHPPLPFRGCKTSDPRWGFALLFFFPSVSRGALIN